MRMKRGDIWWVNFDPSVGGEIRKKRPAIVISNDFFCKNLNRVQVVPLTSNVSRLYASEAYVMVGKRMGKAMAHQLATVSKERISSYLGKISVEDMEVVERVVMVQLGFFTII